MIALKVLILVLMEDTLREEETTVGRLLIRSLNPCSNGRYSQRKTRADGNGKIICLNPCSNGRYSQR